MQPPCICMCNDNDQGISFNDTVKSHTICFFIIIIIITATNIIQSFSITMALSVVQFFLITIVMAMVIINIIKSRSIFMGLSTIIILIITITIFIIIAIITVFIAIITMITFMKFLFANVAGFLITIWFNLPICQWKLFLFLIVDNFCCMPFFQICTELFHAVSTL